MIWVIGGDQPAPAVRQQREREGDRRSRSPPRPRSSSMCCQQRRHVAVEVVDDPVRAEAVVVHAADGRVRRGGSAAGGEERRSSRAPRGGQRGPAARSTSTPVTTPCVVDHRRRTSTRGPAGRERVAQDVVALDHGLGVDAPLVAHGVAGQRALGQPAQRRAALVHQQRRGHVRGLDLPPCLGDRLTRPARWPPATGRRRRTRCEREPLERAVGAHEVLDERVGGRSQQLGRRARTGRGGRPSAGSRSGRPS